MRQEHFFPLLTGNVEIYPNKTVFNTDQKEFVVEAPAKQMRQFLGLCDGHHAIKDIAQELIAWDEQTVQDAIEMLYVNGILVNSISFVDEGVWSIIENPGRYIPPISEKEVAQLVHAASERHATDAGECPTHVENSQVSYLLEQRTSTRTFSGKHIEHQSITQMLWAAYGAYQRGETVPRTVPSGGALYPLEVHLALFQDSEEVPAGIYHVRMRNPREVEFARVSDDMLCFRQSFVDPFVLWNAHGVIVISGSFSVSGAKYGNRGVLYTVLEAGHAAQNAQLAAAEYEVGVVETGGFYEQLLAEAIVSPDSFRPLTTIVFGDEEVRHQQNSPPDAVQEPEWRWVQPFTPEYRIPFFAISASLPKSHGASGKDRSPWLAYLKAVTEAREWAACSQLAVPPIHARLCDLHAAIDPRSVVRFHPAQYRTKRFPFVSFDEQAKYAWAHARDEMSGKSVFVLADLVCFPFQSAQPPYARASSNGVAAHPNLRQALQKSTLELIERDAFMVAYLAKLKLPTIRERTLPTNLQTRIAALREVGFEVWVKDFTLDMAPVVFVFAQNTIRSVTECAACARFDTEDALDHALKELEFSVLHRLQGGSAPSITPQEVRSPGDHGLLYAQAAHFHKADFLCSDAGNAIPFESLGTGVPCSWEELFEYLEQKGASLITVRHRLDEKDGGDPNLHIIRSVIPGLVPISFGYGQEPKGMKRLYEMAIWKSSKTVAYRDMPRFPHPFN